jgi:hypothetical protein
MSNKPPAGDASRTVGRRPARIRFRPSGNALRAGIPFVEEFRGVGAAKIGFPKGLYRFRTHEEMNRADDERIVRALADSVVTGAEGNSSVERK